jgi:predicted GNAT superfamily acetyltransferase
MDHLQAVQPWNSDSSWVVQSIHETAKKLYNDTLHFAAEADGNGDTLLHAFSHSQDFIKGNFAYGDHGQNYKNLVLILQSASALKLTKQHIVLGCPAPANFIANTPQAL